MKLKLSKAICLLSAVIFGLSPCAHARDFSSGNEANANAVTANKSETASTDEAAVRIGESARNTQSPLLANAVPPEIKTAPLDPQFRLSLAAQEVAKDLGIYTGAKELIDVEKQKGADSIDVMRVRQRLLETILIASFEIRSAESRIDDEITRANELRNVLEDRREKKIERNDVLNFVNGGTTSILTNAFADFPLGANSSSTSGLLHAAGAIGVLGGALEIGISTINLRLNRGDHLSAPAHPNLLAPLFGYQGEDARLPEGVWEYLTDQSGGSVDKHDTRRNHLLQSWLHLGRLYSPSTPSGKHQIGLVTGMVEQNKEVTIDLLEDRALMLSDLRAAISQMDVEMLEIIRWVRTL